MPLKIFQLILNSRLSNQPQKTLSSTCLFFKNRAFSNQNSEKLHSYFSKQVNHERKIVQRKIIVFFFSPSTLSESFGKVFALSHEKSFPRLYRNLVSAIYGKKWKQARHDKRTALNGRIGNDSAPKRWGLKLVSRSWRFRNSLSGR